MRELLSELIAKRAQETPSFIMLSGDHGYALFDKIRKESPDKFLNVGVAEQLMVSLAAGLSKVSYRPMVYGLSAFIPLRVLEQIKLDLCLEKLPVVLLGDGAGLVYSTLGASHQCGEDVAALSPLPNMKVFTPADRYELETVFEEAVNYEGPSYIRIGKSDRPTVHNAKIENTEAKLLNNFDSDSCLVSMGSMLSITKEIAEKFKIKCIGLPRVKPFPGNFKELVGSSSQLLVVEEHCVLGGLAAAVHAYYDSIGCRSPLLLRYALEEKFTSQCGSHQHALSEHALSDKILEMRIKKYLKL